MDWFVELICFNVFFLLTWQNVAYDSTQIHVSLLQSLNELMSFKTGNQFTLTSLSAIYMMRYLIFVRNLFR